MNDFISREAAIEKIKEESILNKGYSYSERGYYIIDILNDIPAADVQPVKRGKWIATGRKNVYGGKEIECSECHFRVMVSPEHFENLSEYEAFCCHCGVKMEEE